MFADGLAKIVDDEVLPDRSLIVGESLLGRILVVAFSEPAGDVIRVISARRATNHERRRYESGEEG